MIIAIAALAAVFVIGRLVLPFTDGSVHSGLRWGLAGLLYLAAAAGCLARAARVARDRWAWSLMGAGILAYLAGTVVAGAQGGADAGSAPLAAHVFWLLFYPCAYAALVLLARATLRPFTVAFALDGVLAALALGAVATAVMLPGVSSSYSTVDVIGGLSYPAGDLLLFGFALWIAVLAGWRANPMWRWLVAGFGLLLLGDVALAAQVTASTFDEDAISSAIYPIAMGVLGVAAWQERGRPREMRADLIALTALPAAAVAVVLAVLVIGEPLGLVSPAAYLCFAVLILAFIRMALVYRHLVGLQDGQRFAQGFEEATIGMAIVDQGLRWVRVNPALAELMGVSPRALVGGSVLDGIAEHLRGRAQAIFSDAMRTGDPILGIPGTLVRRDGRTVDVEVTGAVIEGDDGAPQLFTQVRDVTAEMKADRHSEAVTRLTRAALDEPDIEALMREISRVTSDALPATLSAIIAIDAADGQPRLATMPGPVDPDLATDVRADNGQRALTVETGAPVIANDLLTETRFVPSQWLLKTGLRRTLSVPVKPRRGTTAVLAAHRTADGADFAADDARFMEAIANVLASALERAETEAEHRHQALHDPLTGLANRALLAAHIEHALVAAERQDTQVALLLVDLDRFKGVNDTMGHSVGDELLTTVADRLRDRARGGDLVARLGGDEFVVVFDAVASVHEVVPVAQRLIDAIAQPMDIAGREFVVTGSVGIVVADGTASGPDALLRDADVAMYRAKDGGGGRYELFDADLRASVIDRLAVESDLRGAVERNELAVHLQPLIALDTERPIGFEALVRWERPGHGLVPPIAFIGIAEETGLIVEIGEWVLREACRRVSSLSGPGGEDIRVAVNLSARQLTEDLIGTVRSALDDAGLPPEMLTLEITESLLIDERAAVAVLDAVREMGVRLALDDFGTGYSSLSALQRHAVDALKLDRTMVSSVATLPMAAAIARAAVDMAAALSVPVVAEGIEDAEQLRIMRDMGCVIGQGYLFAKPMPAEDAAAYLLGESWREAFAAAVPRR